MNNQRYSSVALIAIVLLFFFGCAGTKKTSNLNREPQPPSNAQPALSESTIIKESELSKEEQMLLEDNQDWRAEEEENIYTVADPLEPLNRVMFAINDKLYIWLMIPVAKGYGKVVEPQLRTGIKNFFFNLAAPIRIVNNILQGKGQAAEAEIARFLYNSTVGMLGFGNPAQNNAGLNPDPEDFGQTLARYGIGDGFYLYLPFLGPSTLRDTVGLAGDRWISPLGFVEPLEASLALSSYNILNTLSFRTDDYETLKGAALDPYESFRNAYIQLRQSRIRR
jgi:phospholipid-binding lipoprotein MlaA